jgi:hypothetical protein
MSAFRYCEEQFEEDMEASFMAKLRMLIRHAALKVQEEKKQLIGGSIPTF